MAVLHILGCCHHLLHEVQPLSLGHAHGHRAGEADAVLHLLTHRLAQLPEAMLHTPQNIGIVAFVIAKHQLALLVNGNGFQCGGPYIESYA